MTYEDAISKIQALEKFGSKPGLSRIRELCKQLGNPQDSLKIIHVAGTNGKGSTSQFITSILIAAGYKVGVYSSPSVYCYRERITINNEKIPKTTLAQYAERLFSKACFFTEFEFATALSLLYFYESKCDYVVLEAGLGGLNDATNIIPAPVLAVLTPISIDHTDILGSAIQAITAQKCGIIKEGSKVCSAPQVTEAEQVIKTYKNVTFAPVPKIASTNLNGTTFIIEEKEYTTGLIGAHQAQNAATAITAVNILEDIKITSQAISQGLKNARIPCRFEVISKSGPTIIFDGAHNPAGAQSLAETLKICFPNRKILLVMGMLAGKDYKPCVRALAPLAHTLVAVTPKTPRALKAETLAKYAESYCERVTISDDVDKIINSASKDEIICVCGSFFMFSFN